MTSTTKQQGENPLLSLVCNIVLPVLILSKVSKYGEHGPEIALGLALLFPLGYGIWDYSRRKTRNFVSILGFVNVLFTGVFALLELEGNWFAVKEASLPAAIGLVVLGSAFTKKPLIEAILFNPQLMQVDKIHSRLDENGNREHFHKHLKISTFFLSGSFFFSSLLNLFLALYIFSPISSALPSPERKLQLNQQIADMHAYSVVVITIPSMLVLMGILWFLITGIKKLTGFSFEELMHTQDAAGKPS